MYTIWHPSKPETALRLVDSLSDTHVTTVNLFKVKDQARSKIKTICMQIMVCSQASSSVGRLKKKKKRKKKKMEKIAVFPFSVYNSSDVF